MLSDFAVVAATHAKHGIAKAKTLAMAADIYRVNDESRARDLFEATATAAYRFIEQKRGAPKDFATQLHKACYETGGNVESVLGVAL